MNLGIKEFKFIVNASHVALDSCQKALLNYEVKMKALGAPLPHFLELDQVTGALYVNNPTLLDVGTHVVQIVLRDIYGDTSDPLDVTIIIETITAAAPFDFPTCFTEPGVIKKPFVQDTMYLIGSLKEIKIHVSPKPMTAAGVNCESLLVLIPELMEDGWTVPQRIPWFLYNDLANRRLRMHIPVADALIYSGKIYQIRIISYLKGRELEKTSFIFKIGI